MALFRLSLSFCRRAAPGLLRGWCSVIAGALLLVMLSGQSVRAQGIELPSLAVSRSEGGLNLDFEVRLAPGRTVEDALRRGVPVYFTAEARVFRPRWYWRDERVASATRTWRVSYQPLTSSWRVSLGAFSQSFESLDGALGAVSRASNWRIAEADQVDAADKYYIEFSYRLDNNLLPRPLQLDLTVQSDWRLSVDRTLRLE